MPATPHGSTPFGSAAVAEAFAACPARLRRPLLALRELIFDVARDTDGVGPLEETLKWGQPAYLTTQSGSGSTVRLGWPAAQPGRYAIYFHCQTTLVAGFRARFPGDFRFEGNRAIVLDAADKLPGEALAQCIATALTYHRNKARAGRG